MDSFLRDLRYGLRMTAKSPAFTAVAIIASALGISATAVSFSLLEAVLWHWLPYTNIDRLLVLGQATRKRRICIRAFREPDYLAVLAQWVTHRPA